MTARPQRRSDRWITPAVVGILIICATGIVLAVAGLVAYLTARGVDPTPVVQLATSTVAAVTGTLTALLTAVGRKTATKTERDAGLLAAAVSRRQVEVVEVDDQVDQLVEDDRPTTVTPGRLPPPPPAARRPRHTYPDQW